ncbi:APC family permease [Brachybacterium sp. EF45031]|uniref:APC family permease n=1 Tax=Brachybacterium sillae TaxID=2810536 RepID=UPI00217E1883|nr:APC family permease [Brachybacterium sillae]MCS6711520.1 APC family permease [Brachybacterium sillae]
MARLKQTLGLPSLIALGVAGVVGSSWIYTSSRFFADLGAGGMILGLLLGASLAACVALAYGELTSAVPRAGGEVVWGYTALGRPAGFATGWFHIGAYLSSLAFYVTAFGTLLGRYVPGFDALPLWSVNGEAVTAPVLAVGLLLTLIVFGLNWFGVSLGAQVQVVLFAIMILIGLALVVTALIAGSPANLWPMWAPEQEPVSSTLRMVVPGITYVVGFSLVAVLAEESSLPPHRVGRAVVLTVACAAAFYTAVLLATAYVVPWETLADPERQGTIDAFTDAGFPLLGLGAFLIGVLGLVTSFLGLFVAASRVVLALSRSRLLPHGLSVVDERSGVPRRALLFVLVATILPGLLGPGAIIWFLDAGGVFLGIVWLLVVIAKYRMPRVYPGLHYGYRARPAFLPAIGAIGAVLVILFALLPGTGLSLVWPAEHLMLVGWALLGVVLYLVTPAPRDAEAAFDDMLGPLAPTLREARRGGAHGAGRRAHQAADRAVDRAADPGR